jgi:hypothetical protein
LSVSRQRDDVSSRALPPALRRQFDVSTDRRAWAVYAAYAAAVTGLHVWGLQARIYWIVPWYDLLTHFLSGIGVAALGGLLGFRPLVAGPPSRRLAAAAATLLLVGAGFEVYERLFRTFWRSWSTATYVEDTTVDVAVDAAGGATYVALAALVGDRDRGSTDRTGTPGADD